MRFLQIFRKRAGRRTAGILTACCLTFSPLASFPLASFPMTAEAAATSGTCGPNATWSVSGTKLTISGSGEVTSGYSFSPQSSNVTEAVIESGITILPQSCFYNFSKLKTLKMPDTVTEIGTNFCCGCIALENLTFSDNLTDIPASAFSRCRALTKLNLPSKLKTVGQSAFHGAIGLTALTLPDGVESVGQYAFHGNNVKTISLGKSLKEIGDNAFSYSCFTSVVIPSTIETIGTNGIGPYWDLVEYENGKILGRCYDDPGRTLIKGTPGSAAETYAKANNFPFEAYGSSHTHSWSDWKVKTAAGCETDGINVRTCSGCGMTEEQTVPATGHSFGEWKTAVQATCTENGRNEHVCSKCKKTESQFVPAIGHDWSDWVTESEPTVSADGLRVKTCHNCGERIEEVLQKLPSYTIRATSGDGGTISPSGSVVVEAGKEQTFTFTPKEGFRVKNIIVDQMEQGIADSYTFNTVTADHVIEVTFEQIPVVPKRSCIQIQVTPQKAAWCSDDKNFAAGDFTITAYFSDNGNVVSEDITNQCSTDDSPAKLTADGSFGFKTVHFRYNGGDKAVQDFQQGMIEASVPVFLRGDFNQDGRVQAADANQTLVIFLEHILENYDTPVSDVQSRLIDVDNDGEITARDAMYILRYYIEKELLDQNISWQDIIQS